MATYADGTSVPSDAKFHVDPTNPMVKVRYLEPWYPPGVTEFFSGGNTARLGLLPNGALLKYARDRENRDALNSLEVEQAVLLALGQHARIVKYLGKHEHGILLELAPNGNIYDYITKHKSNDIPLQLRKKWAKQTAEALVFVHSKDVIHSDLHPRNALLDANLDVQLCDFGGSLFGRLDGGAMESTRFFLPRDWRDPPNIKSDLFAFGSTMYYIMTGSEPYQNLSDDEVTAKFKRKEFPDVETLSYGEMIHGCWTGKFRNAEDVLRAMLVDNSIEA
jgi:serine/threonine protein kinase